MSVSMEVIGHDIDLVEHIHVRSNVKDLIRLKSVCKSWYSLFTSPRFVKRHLTRGHSEDRSNNIGQRRIVLRDDNFHKLVGSSNGLVCVITSDSVFDGTFSCKVGNPLTREVVQLTFPRMASRPYFWGFGYDSFTDDYKVIVGTWRGNTQRVQALSLKTNELRVIGKMKFGLFGTEVGILCNGALHWIVRARKRYKILAFDLATEKIKAIPQPGDTRYRYTLNTKLGIVEDCLCLYQSQHSCLEHSRLDRWIMKDYGVKQSWELLLRRNREMKYDVVHYFSTTNFGTSCQTDCHWDYIEAHAFFQSLVSPRVNGRPEGASDNNGSAMTLYPPTGGSTVLVAGSREPTEFQIFNGMPI
ncbi:F-box protein At3g07870-like [Bidens hawaiensis]|uniref:F-box protein At3g07870-like n=1 Tax=Bidens hawaiensis TaxID=980011 RepID=UPI00404A2DF6